MKNYRYTEECNVRMKQKKKKLEYDSLRDTVIGLFITQNTVKYIIV